MLFWVKLDVYRIDVSMLLFNFGLMVSLCGESLRFRYRDNFEELYGLLIVVYEYNGELVFI